MQRNGEIIWALVSIGIMLMALSIIPAVFAQSPAKWVKTFGSPADEEARAAAISNDGYALAGSTNSSGQGKTDACLVITDPDGSIKFNRTYGGLFFDIAHSIATTNDGGYVLAGSTTSYGAGKADVWLVKVDSLGNMQWNQSFGGPLADYCSSIITSNKGEFILACISQPPTCTPNYGDGDFWLAKVDSHGNLLGNKTYGISAHHAHAFLLITASGDYALGGSTRDAVGNRDFWLAKIGETESGLE